MVLYNNPAKYLSLTDSGKGYLGGIMSKKSGATAKKPGATVSKKGKLQALMRSQEINAMLKKSLIESEALQSSGDDRPQGEDHISKLLEEDSPTGRFPRTKASKTSRQISKPKKPHAMGASRRGR